MLVWLEMCGNFTHTPKDMHSTLRTAAIYLREDSVWPMPSSLASLCCHHASRSLAPAILPSSCDHLLTEPPECSCLRRREVFAALGAFLRRTFSHMLSWKGFLPSPTRNRKDSSWRHVCTTAFHLAAPGGNTQVKRQLARSSCNTFGIG